ncbi:hypothetical protein ACFQGX_01710 [Nonomuraea dietziae]|uniref:hypothetical protein n=1 Tax=Nonomuraea dietziae TaxID=65515 RepID=UPI0036091C0B
MRLPIWSGVATLAVSLTLYPLFEGGAWLWGSLGAVLAVTVAGGEQQADPPRVGGAGARPGRARRLPHRRLHG